MSIQRLILTVLWSLALLPACGYGAGLGIATIVDGSAVLIRGAERYTLAEGAQVEAGDILEAGESVGVVQIETFDSGVVQLASGTRVMLGASEAGAEPVFYLLQGWLKILNSGVQNVYPAKVHTPSLLIHPRPGAVVMHVGAGQTRVFAESGDTEVGDFGSMLGRRVGAGQFYQSAEGRVHRPSREFLAEVPKTLRDSLPSRLARMRSKNVPLVRVADFSYQDVAAWLQGEPALRNLLAERWASKAGDADFRAALVQNINAHPEWRAILNPPRSMADASKKNR